MVGFGPDRESKSDIVFKDLDSFHNDSIVVKVNDINTDLNIGDAIRLHNDKVMTIGSINVCADGTVQYGCEITDDSETKTEFMSIQDIKRLQVRIG